MAAPARFAVPELVWNGSRTAAPDPGSPIGIAQPAPDRNGGNRPAIFVALENASDETGLAEDAFPAECPFTPDQILSDDFLPDD